MSLRLLIVDDDFLFADMLPRLLRKEVAHPPLAISSVRSPQEAFEALDRDTFDVVLCDYDLKAPRTGVDVLRHAGTKAPAPLRILLSGHTAREIGSRMEGVMDAFIEKPMTLPEVLPPLARVLNERLAIPVELRRGLGR